MESAGMPRACASSRPRLDTEGSGHPCFSSTPSKRQRLQKPHFKPLGVRLGSLVAGTAGHCVASVFAWVC